MLKLRLFVIVAIIGFVGLIPVTSGQDEPVTIRSAPPDASQVQLNQIASGFDRPLGFASPHDGTGRLFVIQQSGRVRIVENGGYKDPPFLDVTDVISAEVFSGEYSERGLLGLAFHPNFAENGVLFVNYTDRNGATQIVRYTVSADNPDVADPASAEPVLSVSQPYRNHNGGHLAFGADGYLYIGLGDGGSAGDPQGNGQNPGALLGKMLRIDVDGDAPYTVPDDNPFINDLAYAPEIWALGLRNPWRYSFDRATGDLYIADVGQGDWEEVNFQPGDSAGGENYGWDVYEARHPFEGSGDPASFVMPIAEYGHSDGISITGGYVYRGEAIPDLQGVYLYGDWGSGRIWAAYRDESGVWQSREFMVTGHSISSFGEDEQGEIYLVDYSGSILRFEPAA
jgi:glucose/arabinose dehydrogenase